MNISPSPTVFLGTVNDTELVIEAFTVILGREPNQEYIRDAIVNYPSVLATENGKVIGFAYCGFMSPDLLELANIAIHPQYQNFGLGSKILCRLEEEVAYKYDAIMLTNSTLYGETNGKRNASNFYLENGYTLVANTANTNLFWKSLR
jgi:N-acetylglutamate synthase-like GNAT family acetyltransferase